MRRVNQHFKDALALQKSQVSKPWILIIGLGTGVPLLLGLLRGEPDHSIFGALVGYGLGLCTDAGTLGHRLKVALLAAITMVTAFALGILVQASMPLFFSVTAALIYGIGVLSGKGGELERILVLSSIQFIVAHYTTAFSPSALPAIGVYMLVALCSVMLTNILASRFWPLTDDGRVQIRRHFMQFATLDKIRHYYALTYLTATLIAIIIVEYFHIERGYWTVITAVLIMKPIKKESFNRISQRIFGTVLGLMIGELLIFTHMPALPLAIIATLSAAAVPLVWSRNYWLVALCATIFVICLLEIAAHGNLSLSIAFLRLEATLFGCAISAAVIIIFQLFEPKSPKSS